MRERLGREVSPWPLPIWDLPTCTLAAFYFHPDLAVARAQQAVARAGVVTAGGRPNPTLNVAPGYNFNAASAVSPWMPAMNVDLPIETAGKRRHRISRANQLSEAARLSLIATGWQIRGALRTSLVEFSAAVQQAALLERQRGIQRDLVRFLEQRVVSGAAAAIEVTPSRLALIKSTTDLGEARRRHQADAESLV